MNKEEKQQCYDRAEKLLAEQSFAAAVIVVGISMQYLGRGIDTKFAVAASLYTSQGNLVFWFVAVWFAVFLVKRPLSRADKLALGMHELKS